MFVQKKRKDIKRVEFFPNDEIGEILKDTDNNMNLVKNLLLKERDLTDKTYATLSENIKLNQEIVQTQKEIIFTMGAIGESRSKETGNHVKRVAEYSYLLSKLYGLSEKESTMIREASPMHDIGKVAIADSILNKPAKLTTEEFEIMKTHAKLGYDMLKHSDRPILKTAAIIAYEHHEKYNGRGYPRGLKGDEIHIYGSITAIADVFDALGSDRCYKKAWPLQKIIDFIIEETGEHFHPVLANLFLENLDKFLEIKDKFEDANICCEVEFA
jgi:response regulator RpfG family c-di-GMP phosphodiesterase